MIVLSDIFSPAEANVLYKAAARLEFEDGRRTAGHTARRMKENEQAAASPEREAILEKVKISLLSHPGFQTFVYPRAFASLIVSRTQSGGRYGAHVDNALMAGVRADLSFTLFLSEPETYAGGALAISDAVEDRRFKLQRGEVIVYPSDTLHRVEPVTRGARLVVIGWITSWVRDPRQREILFDLARAIDSAEEARDTTQSLLLSKSRSNLLRMWAGRQACRAIT